MKMKTTAVVASTTTLFSPSDEIKIEAATAGLRPVCLRSLYNMSSRDNALAIAEYVMSMKAEINAKDHYRHDVILALCKMSRHVSDYNNNKNKSFKLFTRQDILAFLDNFRKPEASDPLHQWIGTYNTYRIHLLRFFKWLYHPDIEQGKRPRPETGVIDNIPKLRRMEKSIYKPTDLWTTQDDLLFLKYCPSKRMKCYHVMARDTSCRPHELLKLRIKDIVFKTTGDKQYAEVLVNGKTGSRHIPLIDSIPYIKDFLDHEHLQPGNPNAIFLCGNRKSLGRELHTNTLQGIYARYKKEFFPKLLDHPNIPPEDKERIRNLLDKK